MITNSYYGVAMNDYSYLIRQLPLESYNHTAIQSQQVVEKLLKHLIEIFCVSNEEANDTLSKHNLKKINWLLKSCGIDLKIQIKDLTFLQDYYFDARYPGYDFVTVTKEEADECLKIVEDVKKRVETYLADCGYCVQCGNKISITGTCDNVNCITGI